MSIVPGYPVCKPASIKWMISLAEGTTLILIQGQREGSDLLVFFLLPVLHPLYPSLLPMLCWLSLMSDSAKEKTVIKTWQLIRDVLKRYLLQGGKKHMGGLRVRMRFFTASVCPVTFDNSGQGCCAPGERSCYMRSSLLFFSEGEGFCSSHPSLH